MPVPVETARQNPPPWLDPSTALVIDAYAENHLNLQRVAGDRRIAGIIHQATTGTVYKDCRYHSRRREAKALGLLWGSFHMGRRGDVERQVDDYLSYAQPQADEVVVLDIEGHRPNDMTLDEAVTFAALLKSRIGRYPVIYLNKEMAGHIPPHLAGTFAQMPLWYSLLRDTPDGVPEGIWPGGYTLWQFATEHRRIYPVAGADENIDVSVSPLTVDALRRAWPFTRSNGSVPIASPTASDTAC